MKRPTRQLRECPRLCNNQLKDLICVTILKVDIGGSFCQPVKHPPELLLNTGSYWTAWQKYLLSGLAGCKTFCEHHHQLKFSGKAASYLQVDFNNDYLFSFFFLILLQFKHLGRWVFPSVVQNKWLETPLTHHVTLHQHHHVIMGLYSLRGKPGEASEELWKCFSVQNSAVLIAEGNFSSCLQAVRFQLLSRHVFSVKVSKKVM